MKQFKTKAIIAAVSALTVQALVPHVALAASTNPPKPQFTQAFVRLDRHKELSPTGGTVCATPTVADTEASVSLTFPTLTGSGKTDFVVNATASNWTVSTTNLPVNVIVPNGTSTPTLVASPTAWPGIGTATSVTGHTVVFPSNDLTAGTTYCFNFSGTNTLTTPSVTEKMTSSGDVTTYNSASTLDYAHTMNQTFWSTSTITDDQIAVSAVVPPSFVFSLDGNLDSLGTLNENSVSVSGGRKFTIKTNAKGGWIAWVKDTQEGLYSSSASYTIKSAGDATNATPQALTAGTEGYGLTATIDTQNTQNSDTANPGCSVGIAGEYVGDGTTAAGTLKSAFQTVASCTGPPPATTDLAIVQVKTSATIRGGTPAGSDYSDILTIVGAGNF